MKWANVTLEFARVTSLLRDFDNIWFSIAALGVSGTTPEMLTGGAVVAFD